MSTDRLLTSWAVVVGVLLAVGGACGLNSTAQQPAERPEPHARVLGAPTALARLQHAGLVRDLPESSATYSRAAYGPSLSSADPDHNGCSTREDIMARDLVDRTVEGACNVVRGVLHDPYTGRDVTYNEAVYSGSVQVDHVVPLSYAWRAGAESWDRAKRVQFANDQRLNLLAVEGRANAGKGDSGPGMGPGQWLPLNQEFRCTYARRWAQVLYAYRLRVDPDDFDSLVLLLNHCNRVTS